jgi:hypothetical protein
LEAALLTKDETLRPRALLKKVRQKV